MPALAQTAGTEKWLINYDFGQKTREEPTPGVRTKSHAIGSLPLAC